MDREMHGGAHQEFGPTWQRVRHRLRREVGDKTYRSWFKSLHLEDVSEGRAVMSLQSRFVCNWVISHHFDRLARLWRDEDQKVERIEIKHLPRLQTNGRKPAEQSLKWLDKDETSAKTNGTKPNGSHTEEMGDLFSVGNTRAALQNGFADTSWGRLDERYTFDNFVVGKSNELAHAAARRVADFDEVSFNPLFLYGGVGLGKTHLLQAIAHEIMRRNPSRHVLYVSAEAFVNEFLKSLRNKTTFRFKDIVRNVDVLLLDDVQFIAQKGATQEEFFHTFNALKEKGSQIVISADRSPTSLDGIEERVQSRLGWGLTADIHPTDFELRLAVLKSLAERQLQSYPGLTIPDLVLEFLAKRISCNTRELEGALTSVIGHAAFGGGNIDLDVTREALKDLLKKTGQEVTIETIQRTVAEFYKIRMADMKSERRGRSIARPRQVAMSLCKRLTSKSYPEIGKHFGDRDHTTVMYAVRKIEQLRETDSVLDDEIELLVARLEN